MRLIEELQPSTSMDDAARLSDLACVTRLAIQHVNQGGIKNQDICMKMEVNYETIASLSSASADAWSSVTPSILAYGTVIRCNSLFFPVSVVSKTDL